MSYKVELIPEAQDDFYKLDNSQRLHVKKSLIKLENQGMLAGEALHCLLYTSKERQKCVIVVTHSKEVAEASDVVLELSRRSLVEKSK